MSIFFAVASPFDVFDNKHSEHSTYFEILTLPSSLLMGSRKSSVKLCHPIICTRLYKLGRATHACLLGGLGADVSRWRQSTGGNFMKWWQMQYTMLSRWKLTAKCVTGVRIHTFLQIGHLSRMVMFIDLFILMAAILRQEGRWDIRCLVLVYTAKWRAAKELLGVRSMIESFIRMDMEKWSVRS